MGLVARARAQVYDAVITGMTARWYAAVLERLRPHGRLLDIGIGTGAALLAHADRVRALDLHVVGIDIDRDYVARCRAAVAAHGLADRIAVREESVYDHRGGPYDAAYFSGSFMLLPDPAAALSCIRPQLRPQAPVFFTQTFEHARSPLLERIKPWLRWATTIDFGRVTYEPEFRRSVAAGGFEVVEVVEIDRGRARNSVIVTAHAATPTSG